MFFWASLCLQLLNRYQSLIKSLLQASLLYPTHCAFLSIPKGNTLKVLYFLATVPVMLRFRHTPEPILLLFFPFCLSLFLYKINRVTTLYLEIKISPKRMDNSNVAFLPDGSIVLFETFPPLSSAWSRFARQRLASLRSAP